MPVKQNEQAAGNGDGDAVSAEYLNIPLSEIISLMNLPNYENCGERFPMERRLPVMNFSC
jgi:hypothetical protein